ncbi:MAG TPA: hypothetical protein VFM21_00355 [Terriglobia bacterium]|nr:hypothetical protein [Terriglobia bacterium]
MLSTRLVRMIEDHAEQITHSLLTDLQSNPRTPTYNGLSRHELHDRIYEVYRNLGRWLTHESAEAVETAYTELGKIRFAEDVPLSEVVYALILTKSHLRDYIRSSALFDSAVELYQEKELQELMARFFDQAIYFTVQAYMREAARWFEKFAETRTH